MDFNDIFDTVNQNRKLNESRDKFLSRVFGIFNEEIVRVWCRSTISQFIDKGRPTIKKNGDSTRGSTLDFTLQHKKTKKNFVSEMKCEIQFDNFRYLELKSTEDFKHHNKIAFQRFLNTAQEPVNYEVKIKGEATRIEGAILIWGKTSPVSTKSICASTGLTEILSLEEIINDLIAIEDMEYFELLNQKQKWFNYFIDSMKK